MPHSPLALSHLLGLVCLGLPALGEVVVVTTKFVYVCCGGVLSLKGYGVIPLTHRERERAGHLGLLPPCRVGKTLHTQARHPLWPFQEAGFRQGWMKCTACLPACLS